MSLQAPGNPEHLRAALSELLDASAGSCVGGSTDWDNPLGFLDATFGSGGTDLALAELLQSLCCACAQGHCGPKNHSLPSSLSFYGSTASRGKDRSC